MHICFSGEPGKIMVFFAQDYNSMEFSFQKLLVQLRGLDPVAAEVCYHHSCYVNYTRFMCTAPNNTPVDTEYTKSFTEFCEKFVIPRLVTNKEVFRLTKLCQVFKEFILKTGGQDVQSYKTSSLKMRLKKDHPELVFLKPSRRNHSELVFVDSIGVEDIIQRKSP